MRLNYVIKFVADMDRAVKFYRDVLGFPLKFQSPGWSEFSTGETSLGLHPASEKNTAGSVELGFSVTSLEKFHQEMSARGVQFSMSPTKQDFGGTLAQFLDSEDGRCSVAEEASNSANQYEPESVKVGSPELYKMRTVSFEFPIRFRKERARS